MANRNTSILVIDDSDTIREQIVATLKDAALGANFLEARDGLEGFKILLDTRADLVLCDLEMPNIDGFRFLGMVKSRPELKDIPVIILTGRDDPEIKIRGLGEGASDYVTKPFHAGELIARVKVHLKIKALQDELKKSNEFYRELTNVFRQIRLSQDDLGKSKELATKLGSLLEKY